MRKIDRFTAFRERVDAQKLSRVFAMYVCVIYMSCNACAKTLLSFCVCEQRLCELWVVCEHHDAMLNLYIVKADYFDVNFQICCLII